MFKQREIIHENVYFNGKSFSFKPRENTIYDNISRAILYDLRGHCSVLQNYFHNALDVYPSLIRHKEESTLLFRNKVTKQCINTKNKHRLNYFLKNVFTNFTPFIFDSNINTHFKQLIHIKRSLGWNEVSGDISEIKNILLSLDPPCTFYDRILITRTNMRFLNNHLKNLLIEKYNFKEINLEDFTPSQQAQLFSNAKVIIAVHGAALTNLFLCNAGAIVIELNMGANTGLFQNLPCILNPLHTSNIHIVYPSDYSGPYPQHVQTQAIRLDFNTDINYFENAILKIANQHNIVL